jgi:hypothetical protein
MMKVSALHAKLAADETEPKRDTTGTAGTFQCVVDVRPNRKEHFRYRLSLLRQFHCRIARPGPRMSDVSDAHERQEILDNLQAQAPSRSSKRDIQIRQHFMERSFAHGTRFGLKRARWRGQWRVQIQDYLMITVARNIQLLIAYLSQNREQL